MVEFVSRNLTSEKSEIATIFPKEVKIGDKVRVTFTINTDNSGIVVRDGSKEGREPFLSIAIMY